MIEVLATICAFGLLFSFLGLILGIVSPGLVPIGKGRTAQTRKQVAYGYGGISLALFLIFAFLPSDEPKTEISLTTGAKPASTIEPALRADVAPPMTKKQALDLALSSPVTLGKLRQASREMTELQFAEFVDAALGQKVHFVGWVQGVDDTQDRVARTRIDLDSPTTSGTTMPELSLPVPLSQAQTLSKGEKVYVTGTLSGVDGGMWIDIKLSDPEIVTFD